jgi:hypothetical protein
MCLVVNRPQHKTVSTQKSFLTEIKELFCLKKKSQ